MSWSRNHQSRYCAQYIHMYIHRHLDFPNRFAHHTKDQFQPIKTQQLKCRLECVNNAYFFLMNVFAMRLMQQQQPLYNEQEIKKYYTKNSNEWAGKCILHIVLHLGKFMKYEFYSKTFEWRKKRKMKNSNANTEFNVY